MFLETVKRVVGSKNERELKRIRPLVDAINELEPAFRSLSDLELRGKTEELRRRLDQGETPDDLLPEAFAAVREASVRTLGLRHFDVQLIGGVVLHQGKIAEMKTGEGKTLAATLAAYLNALPGKGVHIVTVNDYLARRDRDWMGPIYEFLGLTAGVIQHDMDNPERQQAYGCDITYGTNNEFGFDYLRDNLKIDPDECVQRELHYAIVDEVDSILIDEARTPLIISGQVEKSLHRYQQFNLPVRQLVARQRTIANRLLDEALKFDEGEDPDSWDKYFLLLKVERGDPKNARLLEYIAGHKEAKKRITQVESELMRDKRLNELEEGLLYTISEKEHNVDFTEEGQQELSRRDKDLFIIPDLDEAFYEIDQKTDLGVLEREEQKSLLRKQYEEKTEKIHNISQLLKAYTLFEKDVEYVVHNGEVIIVDEFTGRMMPGRRYSDGLHQALEAKEGVTIAKPSQTIASITLQNYFRLYQKLAGMTGTADTEAVEFANIYKLEVMVIPTNEPMIRSDHADVIFKTEEEKFEAAVEEIKECYDRRQPILAGTVSIEKSERLSKMLKKKGVPHEVLNAKQHEKEAHIISKAGQPGAVTISTNMAGRGTDIVLGPGVAQQGGLHVMGTERHESRRIDNQLRGRSGRQGDPGSSRFYLSLEDDLMRIFGSDRLGGIMERLGMQRGEAIEHRLVSRAIENAQKKVEARNFSVRKHLLEYDDVNNKQREIVYAKRREIMTSPEIKEIFFNLLQEIQEDLLDTHLPPDAHPDDWNLKGLESELARRYFIPKNFSNPGPDGDAPPLSREELTEEIAAAFTEAYERKKSEIEQVVRRTQEHPPQLLDRVFGKERSMEGFVRQRMLETLDRHWMDTLYAMDHLKEGIGLRGYAQRNPLQEYKKEGFEVFSEMIWDYQKEAAEAVFRATFVEARKETPKPVVQSMQEQSLAAPPMDHGYNPDEVRTNTSEGEVKRRPFQRKGIKVGRNDPCPCGAVDSAGRPLKFKKCCGR
ncbi:MAG: preprotein translocase subunit SecA [bacterium]